MERERREGRDWRGARLGGFDWNIGEKEFPYTVLAVCGSSFMLWEITTE